MLLILVIPWPWTKKGKRFQPSRKVLKFAVRLEGKQSNPEEKVLKFAVRSEGKRSNPEETFEVCNEMGRKGADQGMICREEWRGI